MQTPDHWQKQSLSPLALLLSPLGLLYGLGGALSRMFSSPWNASVPVICVGNLVAGGAGKTPVVVAVAARLKASGKSVHVVSRGYGGSMQGPVRVDPAKHTFSDVGDEPLLLAKSAPTWVSKNRKAGIQAAIDDGADVVVLDDGFQNPSVTKDLSLIVVDGGFGFGNALLIPAGPLREPITSGLARADAVVVVGEDARNATAIVNRIRPNLSVLQAMLQPENGETLKDKRILAFAGIGRPEKFFETLRELGCDVIATRSFPDHHEFSANEIESILIHAKAEDAIAVTTEKDAARLNTQQLEQISVLNVSIAMNDGASSAFDVLLEKAHG